jgi:hypothetical protein
LRCKITGTPASSPRASGIRSPERMVTTLREWGIRADETFFLGGVEPSGPQRGRGEVMGLLRLIESREADVN